MGKPVYCYREDGRFKAEFSSTAQAARYYKVDESSIRKAEQRNCKCRGLYWSQEYRESYFNKPDGTRIQKAVLPKILILDIETAPLRAYTWGIWKQNINQCQMLGDWFCLTWSAKWLFSGEVMSDKLTGKEVIDENDGRIMMSLWNLLNQADIVVAHNGISFDIPKINTRFLLHGLPPTTPYKVIDTLKVAQGQFAFTSNKLDSICKVFGIEGKKDTSFELWAECMKGNERALAYMEEYNRNDVEILEEVYLRLRPWIKNHPNANLYIDSNSKVCAHCGSTHLLEHSYYYTSVNRYLVYQCECGALCRSRISELSKEEKKRMVSSLG